MIDIFQSIEALISTAKRARDVSRKMENAEFNALIAQLIEEAAEAKVAAAEMKVRLSTLVSENDDLKRSLQQKAAGTPTADGDTYTFPGEEDHRFCTACHDVHGKKVRLARFEGPFTVFGKYKCPSCKATYGKG
jgi:hypothetical protein